MTDKELLTRVFKALGHAHPIDTFSEEEVHRIAVLLEADPEHCWGEYSNAVLEADPNGPLPFFAP
jgi:hypothetical protein